MVNELFDDAFDRTFNVQYLCGDFDDFKKIYTYSDDDEDEEEDDEMRQRPVMLISA